MTHSLCKLPVCFRICLAPWGREYPQHTCTERYLYLKQKNSTHLLPNSPCPHQDVQFPTLPHKSHLAFSKPGNMYPASSLAPQTQTTVLHRRFLSYLASILLALCCYFLITQIFLIKNAVTVMDIYVQYTECHGRICTITPQTYFYYRCRKY